MAIEDHYQRSNYERETGQPQRSIFETNGLIAFAAATSVFVFGTAIAYKVNVELRPSNKDIVQQEKYVSKVKAKASSDHIVRSSIEAQIGAKCLPLVKFYSRGDMASTATVERNTAYIVNDPQHLCGDNTLQVSQELVGYKKVENEVNHDNHRVAHSQAVLASDRTSSQMSDWKLLERSAEAGAVVVGICAGAVISLAGLGQALS
jgi:hypothetical protein